MWVKFFVLDLLKWYQVAWSQYFLPLSALSTTSRVAKRSDKSDSGAAASTVNTRSPSGIQDNGSSNDPHPIPPKHTKRRQKACSRSNSITALLLRESGNSSTNSKEAVQVFKKLPDKQQSSPESGGRVKPPRPPPPRPPPPNRQIPPITYAQLDTRALPLRQHSVSLQPKRPQFPWDVYSQVWWSWYNCY